MEVSCACAGALAAVLTAAATQAAAQATAKDEDAVADAAYAAAADVPEDAAVAVPGECYTGGSVAGAVVGTFLATLVLVTAAVLIYKFYWRGRRGKHLILTKDPEAGGDQYAFDNPCFRDGSPLARPPEKEPIKIEQKTKWAGWPSLTVLAGNKTGDKRRALDDSCLSSGETPAQPRLVTLRSRDFTGLGFNVCGNMRDGIFVRDVQHRGPAFESGCIQPGDRIEAVRISFRHMVFEDALTILSYASPYEVQLELESAAPAAPVTAGAGSLLRPRRGAAASSLAATERIVHPFFRSQSSADLAQISKASLRRTQQMGGVAGGKVHQSQANEEMSANEYPTLKLSSSPPHSTKENTRLEKTAPTAVVKPERVKRTSTPKEPDLTSSGETNTLSKFQKFGVRVLPDPAPRHTSESKPATVEAEKHQNEQNLIKERVGGSPVTDVLGNDTVDSENIDSMPLHYDERGIDVGPINVQPVPSTREHQSADKQHHRSASTDDEDGHKENNVKQLLTKGLQNLKEKLHHDKRSTSSPECPLRSKDKKLKPARQHKTSMSSDSEGLDGERSVEGTMKSKIKQEPEKVERRRQRNPEKEGQNETIIPPPGSGIPSEIPEEVRRAAVAARSNRKSLQATPPTITSQEIRDSNELPQNPSPHVRETASESSSDEGGLDANGDSSGRPPKRSNKRKAPPPPAEDFEHNYPNSTITVNNAEVNPSKPPNDQQMSEENYGPESSDPQTSVGKITVDSTQTKSAENGQVISTPANITRHNINSESSGKDITNITIDDSNVLNSLPYKRTIESDNAVQGNSFPVDSSSSGTSTMETKTGDYEEALHVNTVNSDSDSDLERLEGDEDSYDRKRGKKGGTTIELNSSHITIHHSPSSETMQMSTAELDSDSTRKAASLGDLSRLDSEQPMSILERAVSLDLGDGGTPHSSKKRKAPLPPPGEEYLSSVQDTEDGAHYRKEPRLDNAMDTFQRRRLKKSSDWGTLEEALRQTDSPSTSGKAPNAEVARLEVQVSKQNSVPEINDGTQNEIANLADDQKVKLSGLAQKFLGTVRAEAVDVSGIEPLDEPKISNPIEKTDTMELSGRSSPECDHSAAAELDNPPTESMQQRKTVLHISPSPTKKASEPSHLIESITGPLPSQVTITSSSVLGIGENMNDPTNHEVTLTNSSSSHRPPISPRQRSGNIISSTPLPNRDRTSPSQLSPVSNSSGAENYMREALQSPLVTSSDIGISNVHVVSSTTQDTIVPSESESSHLVSSATDHFVTAASIVDSTSTAEEMSDNEDTWGNDQQPPELPTSPVPVLSQTSSSFPGSPSLTYITEIQVVTTTNGDNNQAVANSGMDVTRNGTAISSSFIQHGIKNNKSESSMSSDTLGSGGVTIEDTDMEPHGFQTTNNTSVSQMPRSSITVTSIRTSSDTSGGQSGGTVTETTNHVGEKKPKPARPPVPPRKSDLSSPSSSPPSMSSSTIMVEVPKIRLTETTSSSLLAGGTVSQVNPAAAGKFISFSSLPPRAEGSSTRHGSSFEQWVFLDDSTPTGHHNGFENSVPDGENGQHSNVLTLPGLSSNRAQTVTHIILDTKQNSGGQVQE